MERLLLLDSAFRMELITSLPRLGICCNILSEKEQVVGERQENISADIDIYSPPRTDKRHGNREDIGK